MLQTTVNYLSLLETKRHNVVTESQGAQQLDINRGELAVHQGQLAENVRHNQVTEEQGWASILETKRHNLVSESISQYDADTRRRQLDINWFDANTRRFAAEQNASIGWANVDVAWANVAIGREQAHTQAIKVANDYSIGSRNADANIQKAQADSLNAETRARELEEKIWKDQADIENRSAEIQVKENEYELAKKRLKVDTVMEGLHMYNESMRNVVEIIKVGGGIFQTILKGG